MAGEPGRRLQRLHPVSVLFHLLDLAWGVLGPLIVAFFFARRGTEPWVAALSLPVAALAVLRYLAYGYRFDEHELVVRQGLLTRRERHIPYGRIQNLNLIEGPLHRAWHVAEVRVETAAGKEPEAQLRVLALAEVEALRARVREARTSDADAAGASAAISAAAADAPGAPAAAAAGEGAAPGDGRPLVTLSARELVLAGLVRGRGGLVVAAALGLAVQLDLVSWETFPALARGLRARWREALTSSDHLATLGLAAVGVLVLVLALRLLSIAWALVKFHGFTLTRQGDDLRTEFGLVTRVTAGIPRHRIQRLLVESRPLHRASARLQVLVETAGGRTGAPTHETGHLWLAPILPENRVEELVAAALPGVSLAGVEWQPVSRRARRRRLTRALLLTAIVAVAGAPLLGAWALVVVGVGLLLGAADATLWVRRAGWAMTPRAFMCRTGWWERHLSVVRLSKIQVVAVRQNPFDRRFGMATVEVDTAGAGHLGHRTRIPCLDADVAAALARRLAAAASATAYRW